MIVSDTVSLLIICKQPPADTPASLTLTMYVVVLISSFMTYFVSCLSAEEERRVRANDREYNEKFQYAVRDFSPLEVAKYGLVKDERTLIF